MVQVHPAALAGVAFAVVACSSCRHPWAVDLRHANATCPRCRRTVELARRRRLWQGDSARAAGEAAGALAQALAQGQEVPAVGPGAEGPGAAPPTLDLQDPRPVPRHDDVRDAAAAQARHHRNAGRRAEEVALWLTRLAGGARHEDLVESMVRAGLSEARAEKEVVRMLAGDIIFEPRAGTYRVLEA